MGSASDEVRNRPRPGPQVEGVTRIVRMYLCHLIASISRVRSGFDTREVVRRCEWASQASTAGPLHPIQAPVLSHHGMRPSAGEGSAKGPAGSIRAAKQHHDGLARLQTQVQADGRSPQAVAHFAPATAGCGPGRSEKTASVRAGIEALGLDFGPCGRTVTPQIAGALSGWQCVAVPTQGSGASPIFSAVIA